MSGVNVTQLAFTAAHHAAVAVLWRPEAAAAAIDRYLLHAEPTAANQPQWHAAVGRWDRQTLYPYTDPDAYYASNVNKQSHKYQSVTQ